MATTSDLTRGMLIMYNGAIHRVVEYEHSNPGNWRAFVRMRLKNFKTGKVIEDRVRAGSDIEIVTTQTRSAQFLYKEGEMYHFMDNESFDQIALMEDIIGDRMKFIKENESVDLLMLEDGKVLDVEPPTFVILEVTQADIAVRGDTASSLQKNVTLETGATVKVPAFISQGDKVRVDTRSGEYVDRG
ncbi:MAG TPA: elongation factor P [Caldilineaceae bacterium]|nr:elongation factor P [Caldilineaceae bacterium]